MLTSDEKKAKREDFINSEKFGYTTYLVLGLFLHNLKINITTIKAYDVLVLKLEQKIESTMNEKQIFKVKQQMLLDIYSKILSIIESILILSRALSEDYRKVPKIITFYPYSFLNQTLEDFINKKCNMRKLLGMPDLEKLDLNIEERKALSLRYENSGNTIAEIIKGWAEFYNQLRIIYGKSRHGLSYMTGIGNLTNFEEIPKLEETWMVAFDKRSKEKLPHGTISIDPKDEKQNKTWFDIQSWLKIDTTLFSKVGGIIDELDQIGTYIIENHLFYADNCGEYLPSKINGDRIECGVFYGEEPTSEEKSIISKICERIGKNLLIVDRHYSYTLSLDNPNMIKSLNQNMITNFWFGKD